MTDLRKKLEALVEREAEKYVVKRHPLEWSWEEKEAFRVGAHLLLDAVVEMQEAIDLAQQFNNGLRARVALKEPHYTASSILKDMLEKALSSLEKRIAEARASGEEKV